MTRTTGAILTGGTIVDGTGATSISGEVVIRDGRIVSVGNPQSSRSVVKGDPEYNVVDCRGCIIAPGFIDVHSHSDLQVLENRTEKLLQGVTTEIVGNCGFSPYPAPADRQPLHEFANGIFRGGDAWGWNSAAEYLASAAVSSRLVHVVSLV